MCTDVICIGSRVLCESAPRRAVCLVLERSRACWIAGHARFPPRRSSALKNTLPRIVVASAVLVAIAALTTSTGKASNGVVRRGGPRHWSHGRLVASDYGPDQAHQII